MKFNAQCPDCGSEIKFFEIFIRLTPLYLKCSRCAARLRLSGTGPATVAATLVVALGVGAVLGYTLYLLIAANEISMLTAILILMAAGAAAQIALCLWVVNGKLMISAPGESRAATAPDH